MTFPELIKETASQAQANPSYLDALENQLRSSSSIHTTAARSAAPKVTDSSLHSTNGDSGFISEKGA